MSFGHNGGSRRLSFSLGKASKQDDETSTESQSTIDTNTVRTVVSGVSRQESSLKRTLKRMNTAKLANRADGNLFRAFKASQGVSSAQVIVSSNILP